MGKTKDADLILKLYDLRRESVMREARNWFFSFNPQSAQDFIDVMVGDKSAYFRMVVSYWEMAASFVNHGAIDEQMFNDANGEHVFVYAKIEPFLGELRQIFGSSEYLANLEKAVRRLPNIDQRIADMRERMKRLIALREEKAAKAATAT
ncbi:MAG TPA: hypothetical protein VMM84_10025 [Pyrinomonadaceae bacterium]|nr:hypothetical protein [Pyrinomonadaceae bacterium]